MLCLEDDDFFCFFVVVVTNDQAVLGRECRVDQINYWTRHDPQQRALRAVQVQGKQTQPMDQASQSTTAGTRWRKTASGRHENTALAPLLSWIPLQAQNTAQCPDPGANEEGTEEPHPGHL
jgi:hypothetical protein